MKKVLIATTAMLLAGCATQNYIVSEQAASRKPTFDRSQAFFLNGIGQKKEVNASEVCHGASNVTKVQTQQTFLNGLLGGLTNSIYSPRTMRVYCK